MVNNFYKTILISIILGIHTLSGGWKEYRQYIDSKWNDATKKNMKELAHGILGGIFFTSLIFSTKDIVDRITKRKSSVHGLIITTSLGALLYSWWAEKNIIPTETVIPKVYDSSIPPSKGIAGKKMQGFFIGVGASLLLKDFGNQILSQFPYTVEIVLKKVCNRGEC